MASHWCTTLVCELGQKLLAGVRHIRSFVSGAIGAGQSGTGRALGGVVHDAVLASETVRIDIPAPDAGVVDASTLHARSIRARRWFAQSSLTHHASGVDPERLAVAERVLEEQEAHAQRRHAAAQSI